MGWWNVSTHKQTNLLNCNLKTSTFTLKMDQVATKQLNHNQCRKPDSHRTNKWYMINVWRSHTDTIISSFPVLSSKAKETLPRLNQHPQTTTKPANKPAAKVLPADMVFPVFFKNKAKGFVAFGTRPTALARCSIVGFGFRPVFLDAFPLTTLEATFLCSIGFEAAASTPNSALSSLLKSARRGPGDCGETGDGRSGETCSLGTSFFSFSKGESLDCEPAYFSGCFPVSRSFSFDTSTMAWNQARHQPAKKKCTLCACGFWYERIDR